MKEYWIDKIMAHEEEILALADELEERGHPLAEVFRDIIREKKSGQKFLEEMAERIREQQERTIYHDDGHYTLLPHNDWHDSIKYATYSTNNTTSIPEAWGMNSVVKSNG